ncbi:hypothetical protein EJB05_37071, partial [Eragrostis curvula]
LLAGRHHRDREADDGGDDGGSGTMDTSGEGERTPHTPFNVATGTNRSKCRTNNNQDGSSSTNPKMRVFHSPVRFCNVVKKIKESKEHVQAIESIGFGGLLQMPSISLRKNMLKDIADVYDISNRGFKLCGQIVRFPVEDVHNILGLEISGNDVMQYINKTMKSEDETVRSELFQRFATNNKLELQGLENMLHKDRPADGDFVRAFVLFTIGVLLASNTGPTIHWSYIEAVRDIAQIPLFNWGQFTLNHLLNSCTSYINRSEKTLKGNLVLLQFWYWERVRVANQHGIKYEERITRPPVMVFWNEENAKRRQTAWEKDGLDGGTVVQSLEHWKKATKLELKLDLEQKLLELEHKQDMKILEHKKEFASFRNDSILEDRINNLEAKEIHELVRTLIDQPISQTGHAQQHVKVINAYVQLSDVENDIASFISTFDVQKLADTRWELTKNYKKRIADKCKGKHLVFVPMNINGNHWGLLVLNFIKHEVQILESLSLRDEELEMTLVESIQCCVEFSIMEGLVNFENPFDLREWEIVPYVDIPRQDNSFTCAAFVIQYILAWDGEKMAHEFTSKEAYLLENPDEQEGHRHDSDVEDLQIISSATETQSKGEAITASGTTMTRRPRGRPRKIRVDEVSAKVSGIEEGTPKVKGAATRKRGKPSRITADTATRTVLEDFSTESIANRINKRKKQPGKLLSSPYQPN